MKKSWFKEFKFKIGIVCRLYNFNGIVDNSFKFLIIETKKKKNKREKLKYRLLHLRSTTLRDQSTFTIRPMTFLNFSNILQNIL